MINNKENLLATGLLFNILGTIVLVVPAFRYKIWDNDNEDEIPSMGWGEDKKGNHWFTRKGLLRTRRFALWGLFFIFLGFLLQLLSILCV